MLADAVRYCYSRGDTTLSPVGHGLPLLNARKSFRDMISFLSDVRYAMRSLRRSPSFTVAAVLTIALGIGATTVIFSAVNRVLLHPMPFKGGDRMVYAWLGKEPSAGFVVMPTVEMFEAWRSSAHSFEAIEAYNEERVFWNNDGVQTRVSGIRTSSTFLSFLGLSPARGRMFSADEAERGGQPVALLGYGFWRREFGGRPDVVGRSVTLDNVVYDIVGVVPERVSIFARGDVWLPLQHVAADAAASSSVSVVARLRPGITVAQAQQELADIGSRLPGNANSDWSPRVMEPEQLVSRNLRSVLPILFGAVVLVLLIACANVALLLLARGAARQRELAIRLSLGAGRRRLVRQLVVESGVVALAGGALAMLLVGWGVNALSGLRPESLSDLAHVSVDANVLLFALGASAVTALLVGVVPAIRTTDLAPAAVLRSGEAGAGGGRRGRLRTMLVAGEMMLSVMLLVGAGLLIRSLMELQRADLGFDATGLLTVQTSLPDARYPDGTSRTAFTNEVLARARVLPGVVATSVALDAPPRYGMIDYSNLELARTGAVVSTEGFVTMNMVRPDYFQVLGVRMLQGRSFTEEEDRAQAQVIVMSEGLAKKLSPGESLVGQQIRSGPKAEWLTVVGIAADVAAVGITGRGRHAQLYYPLGDGPKFAPGYPPDPGKLIVRARGDASALAPALRAIVHDIDPTIPAPEIAIVQSSYAAELAAPRFNTLLLAIFAGLALVLAAVGLFGVLSYAVSTRTREIGIRVALGARAGDVRALVVRQGMLPVLAGLLLGVIAALFAVRVLASLLYGVPPRDAVAFVAAGTVLTLTALAACYLPARRATRVDPITALKTE